MENMTINGATVKPIDGIVVSRDSFGQVGFEQKRTSHRITIDAQPEDRNVYLSDIFNQTPYGLIDKRATGIGATELEICAERKSVLVFPTRALAESKCRKAEKDFEEKGIGHLYGLFYVGSMEDDQTSVEKRLQLDWDQRPEKHDDSCYTKLFVVADSLEAALNVAGIDEGEGKYFLLVDEVDTYQIDSTYRTRLADVVDTYFRWNRTCRAMVSATFRHNDISVLCDRAILYPLPEQHYAPGRETISVPHSLMKDIRTETWTIIEYKNPVKPEFKLRYTSDILNCITATIHEIADTAQKGKTILVAFNNVKSISDIIKKLKRQRDDLRFGVLFSEHAEKRDIEEYRISQGEFNGYLRKNEDGDSTLIVFMTCAYYVGIDIYDEGCHLIMVSAFNNDFSQLSVQRIDQIRGRLRNGSASNTIIYNSWEWVKVCKKCDNKEKFLEPDSEADICSDCVKIKINLLDRKKQEEFYLRRATLVADLQNTVSRLLKEQLPVNTEHAINRINSIINDAVRDTDMDAVPLTRQDSDGTHIPYYLNLDAMVDQWNTKYRVYGNRSGLKDALEKYYGKDTVTEELPYFPDRNGSEHIKTEEGSSSSNKEKEKEEANRTNKFKEDVDELFRKLSGKKTGVEKHELLSKNGGLYMDGSLSFLKRTVLTYLDYISLDDMETLVNNYVFEKKNRNASDIRHLSRFHAALGFMLLEDSHPFKQEVLTAFGCPLSLLTELKLKKPILITDRNERMKKVIAAFKPEAFIPPSQQAGPKKKSIAQERNKRTGKAVGVLTECFFEKTNSNNNLRIIGLYPKAFKTPDGKEILQIKDEETKMPITPIKRIHPEEGEDYISKYFLPTILR